MPGGRVAVRKSAPGMPGQLAAEAAGLRWLAEPGAVPVAAVLGLDDEHILVEYLPSASPDRAAAERFGAGLARLHAAGADAFGVPPPGGPSDAWIGTTGMRNEPGTDWPTWYVEQRVLPYLRAGRDAGSVTAEEAAEVEAACRALPEVAGPPVPPARLHGDLWSGNVCWSAGPEGSAGPVDAWLIDPAAHGGHPETDLAMLALFGCPHLDAVLAGYRRVTPLGDGWADRVGLHQLFPLLVHVVLFGRGYTSQALAAARSTTRLLDGIP
ncbi:MAG TPA: fructosamine kinase family protein [Pseudonocardia sp.]